MSCFLFFIAALFLGFALGYWVSSHPTDTRAFLARVRDSLGRLVHKEPPKP
jgi:hypothetical protein